MWRELGVGGIERVNAAWVWLRVEKLEVDLRGRGPVLEDIEGRVETDLS